MQKWKKAREAKKKEKEILSQTMVEDLSEKLNKSSDTEVSEDDIEPNKSSFKDTYNFHNGNIFLNNVFAIKFIDQFIVYVNFLR